MLGGLSMLATGLAGAVKLRRLRGRRRGVVPPRLIWRRHLIRRRRCLIGRRRRVVPPCFTGACFTGACFGRACFVRARFVRARFVRYGHRLLLAGSPRRGSAVARRLPARPGLLAVSVVPPPPHRLERVVRHAGRALAQARPQRRTDSGLWAADQDHEANQGKEGEHPARVVDGRVAVRQASRGGTWGPRPSSWG